MTVLVMIFFFGVAMSLIVLKGLFMTQEYSARTVQAREARERAMARSRPEVES